MDLDLEGKWVGRKDINIGEVFTVERSYKLIYYVLFFLFILFFFTL